MNRRTSIPLLSLASCVASLAAPITTVPWNGYTGAASFGYDDARGSQLTTLMPQLDKTGIKATFFIANMYTFPSQKTDWTGVAKKGHELANHTSNHGTPTTSNVQTMASTLRGLDPSVQAVTLAYPGCTVTGQSAVGAEAFLARGCQWGGANGTRYNWSGNEPDWMNILGLCMQPNNASQVTTFLDGAKSGNSWAVIFSHDVNTSPDEYSVKTSDHQTILDKAIANKLWIGTYQEVGAYYRAHFTMDKVAAASGSGPWNLTWTSPHPKMPKSVKLKIKLDTQVFGTAVTVSQDNAAIPANSDGSYTIDFMKLKMNVTKGASGVRAAPAWPADWQVRAVPEGIALQGPSGTVEADVVDLRGVHVFHGKVDGLVPLPDRQRGLVVVRLTDPATGIVAQRTLHTIR